jgi:chorismate dehydratase
VRVSVVSYLNSLPFISGLEQLAGAGWIILSKDIPSECARKLLSGEVDIGLVPVAVIPQMKEYFIVSDYCIGAFKEVQSVMLYSRVPLNEIKTILLDHHSRTSALLVQLLAIHHWKINPQFVHDAETNETLIKGQTAALIIGDRALSRHGRFPYQSDLAEAWYELTGLPFVFACWVSNRKPEKEFENRFKDALKTGVESRNSLPLEHYAPELSYPLKRNYIDNIIHYEMDEEKRKGMNRFLEMIKGINSD